MEEIAMSCPPGTVAVYLRVSSQVQRRRETIASQREAVLDHARRRGWLIPDTGVFADDGFSGATLERPALEALRDGVASGEIETVLVWSIDRLSRNFAHQILLQEEFARTGATIACVEEPDNATPQGMLLRQILSVISEYERTQIAERSRRGKIHRARQGSLNMLSRPPYGYRLIRKTETCGARLEVDDTEARVVRRIYDLYVRDGLKMHEIGPRLDAQGVRPRHAQHWSCSTVAVILRNEAYIGKAAYLKTMSSGKRTRHNRTGRQKAGAVRRLTSRTARAREEWIELPVPVIVDEAVFARAQQQRAVNRRFSPRKTIEQTLLQGLCVCGHCGYAMGRHSGGSSGTTLRRHYYRCHGIDPWRRPHGAVCDNPVVRADELDEAVWKEVLALLENPELIQCEINRRLAVANDTVAARRRIDTLHSELARIETRLRRLLDAYQEEVITLDELRERKGPLQTRQQSIVSELKALQTAELDRASRLSLATTMERFLQRMREGAQSVSLAERQRIVRLLVREVQVGKETVTICHSIPIESAPPDASGPSRNEPSEKASGHGALLVPRCRQVVEHQRAVAQVASGQTLLDGALALEQPVHGGVELVFVDALDAEHLGEGVARGVGGEPARGGELRAWGEDARDNEGNGAFAFGRGGGGEGAVEAQLAQRSEHCGDVAVGARAGDIEGGGEVGDGGAAFEQDSQSFDHHGRPLRQVGEGAFTDLAGLAIGFAQQDGGRGVSIGDGLDVHGY